MTARSLTPSEADAMHARWLADLEELAQLVRQLFLRQQIFEAIDDELVRRGLAHPGTPIADSVACLCDDFLRPMYGESQASILRRLVDKRADTKSFVRLLASMKRHPEVLSRARYVAHYIGADSPRASDPQPWLDLAKDDFDRIAGKGATHVPITVLQRHEDTILADLKDVKRYVDKRIAHHGIDHADPLTWGQLASALQRAADHLAQFSVLVAGATWMASPTIQFDWQAALRPALFTRRA